MGEQSRVVHDISFNGNLFSFLWAMLRAYDRRTNVMARASATDPEEVKALTAKVKSSADEIQQAVERAQGPNN